MKIRNVLIWLACLFVLPWLSGCGEKRQAIRYQPQPAIEVPVPAYRPLDKRLTVPLAEPPAPARHCTYAGLPAVCALDGLSQIEAWRGALQQCNADRSTSAKVTDTGER